MAIVKILSRHKPSYASLIRYILKDGSDKTEIYTQNLRSENEQGYVKEFIENESFRKQTRSDQVYLFHEIVSFSDLENSELFDHNTIRDLATHYMKFRGNDGVILGAVHRDKEHVHLHFCVSALKFRTGNSFRLSKENLSKLKAGFQEYHLDKYPLLSNSNPNHGVNSRHQNNEKWQALNREKRLNLKEEISKKMIEAFESSKNQSEFLEKLQIDGYHHYERNGKATGIELDGMRFRFSRTVDIEELSQENTSEQLALQEIKSIREKRQSLDRNISLDHDR